MSGSHQYGEPAIGPVSSRLPGVAGNRVEEFVTLLGQHQRRLHLFVWSLVPNVADAEDILQETNLVLWREFHQFQAGTNFISWASTVAFNQVLAWRKRKQRERLVFSDVFLSAVSAELGETADLLEERACALAKCVERIPPHHRDLLHQRYDECWSVDAIAAHLQRSTEAVYRMLSRIRQTLYDCVSTTLANEGNR